MINSPGLLAVGSRILVLLLLSYFPHPAHGASTAEGVEIKAELQDEDLTRADLVTSLFRRHNIRDAHLSPDGSMAAYFDMPNGIDRRLVVLHHEQKRRLILRQERDADGSRLRFVKLHWIDNTRIAYQYEKDDVNILAVSTLQFEDGKLIDAFLHYLGSGIEIIDPLPHIDRLVVLYGEEIYKPGERQSPIIRSLDYAGKSDSWRLRIVDVTDPFESEKFEWPDHMKRKLEDSHAWLFDTRGDVRLIVKRNKKHELVTTWSWSRQKRKWLNVWEHSFDVEFRPIMLSGDGKSLLVITDFKSDYSVLARFDIDTKSFVETIYSVPGADVNSAITNPEKTRIVRVGYVKDGLVRFDYLDGLETLLDKPLDSTFAGRNAYVVDRSMDEQIVLVRTSDTSDPGEIHVLNLENGRSYAVGAIRPWMNDYKLGSSQIVLSTSTSGAEIESYLTMPRSAANRLPPLIVMPHGGPKWVRDSRHFDEYTQYLAVLGYAVLQPNYRGSGGYGKSFLKMGEGQWGRLIEDDIESAVQVVIDRKLVDHDKICIFGTSYGGYSALISAVRRPDLYKCAASFAGVTDLPLLFHDFQLSLVEGLREIVIEIVGDPETDIETLVRYSPAFVADQIGIPVFLSHGTDDFRVDVEHYNRMKLVLEHFGKDAEYLLIPGAGHGFDTIDEEVIFLTKLDRFFRNKMSIPFPQTESVYEPAAVKRRLAEIEKLRGNGDDENNARQAD